MSFHEVRFPTGISRGAQGGPERRTDVVVLGSGFEERNSRWIASRRSYDAGYGVRSLDALHEVIAFFEERRGRFHGFRWRDHADWKSSAPGLQTTPLDQAIGIGDGAVRVFQLRKTYGANHAPFVRDIKKPVAGTVKVAVNGAAREAGTDFGIDPATGIVLFTEGEAPAEGAVVTAGFEFDVPVRFDTDKLEINLSGFQSGAIGRTARRHALRCCCQSRSWHGHPHSAGSGENGSRRQDRAKNAGRYRADAVGRCADGLRRDPRAPLSGASAFLAVWPWLAAPGDGHAGTGARHPRGSRTQPLLST